MAESKSQEPTPVAPISPVELDAIARAGLHNLKTLVSGSSAANKNAAAATLKTLSESTKRYSAENNRAAIMLKFGEKIGANGEDLNPMWKQITGRAVKPKPKD